MVDEKDRSTSEEAGDAGDEPALPPGMELGDENEYRRKQWGAKLVVNVLATVVVGVWWAFSSRHWAIGATMTGVCVTMAIMALVRWLSCGGWAATFGSGRKKG